MEAVQPFHPHTRSVLTRLKTAPELYTPVFQLPRATPLDENESITYHLDQEYCISSILLEYHSGRFIF